MSYTHCDLCGQPWAGHGTPCKFPTLNSTVSFVETPESDTIRDLRTRLAEAERLLYLYRAKRTVDGLNGRCWDATAHYHFESLIRVEDKSEPLDARKLYEEARAAEAAALNRGGAHAR